MRAVLFCQSLVSDWNHGNAHFLRGIVAELQARGIAVDAYEPHDGWSISNLVIEHGPGAIARFRRAFPGLTSTRYELQTLDLERALDGADLVLVHEWNEPELIRRIGELRRQADFRLLFHDTHHRAVTDRRGMEAFDLRDYDGVLAFGAVIRDLYLENGWAQRAWTWHEAADTRVFRPVRAQARAGDVVWIGNWGDEERSAELRAFLIEPVRDLALAARVYGVRYPEAARRELAAAGIEYAGWLPNYEVPATFAGFGATVHIPRRPYVELLPGIPTIRVFEALACGIPLICSPWDDAEGLFTPGADFLVARDGAHMRELLRAVLSDETFAAQLAVHGRRTILARHTCAHRVDELLGIYATLAPERTEGVAVA